MNVPSPETPELVAAEVVVSGDVQGVGYRAFTQRAAKDLGLSGWVRNLYDGRVQVEAEGPRAKAEELLGRLRRGPSLAEETDGPGTWKTPTGGAPVFTTYGIEPGSPLPINQPPTGLTKRHSCS